MTLAQRGTTPVVGFLGSLTRVERTSLAQLAIKYRLPSMFGTRENMETGGLMSYAPDQARNPAGGASFKIPVGDQCRYGKLLGLHLPPTLLALADDLIG